MPVSRVNENDVAFCGFDECDGIDGFFLEVNMCNPFDYFIQFRTRKISSPSACDCRFRKSTVSDVYLWDASQPTNEFRAQVLSDVHKGEVIGIIGRKGAGNSTLRMNPSRINAKNLSPIGRIILSSGESILKRIFYEYRCYC